MSLKILVGNEPYLKQQFVNSFSEEFNIERTNQFLMDDHLKLKQMSFFGSTVLIVSGKLSKESEVFMASVLDEIISHENTLIYVPEEVDRRKNIFKLDEYIMSFTKLKNNDLREFLKTEAIANNVTVNMETLEFLIEYSEYEEVDSVTLFDLVGFIRGCSGTCLTDDYIKSVVCRPEKDNAFKVIELMSQPAELSEYLNRLAIHPQAMIGALVYGLRIMAKLKISQDFGLGSYQMNQYLPLSKRYTLCTIVDKLEALSTLRTSFAPKEAQKSLIYAILSA